MFMAAATIKYLFSGRYLRFYLRLSVTSAALFVVLVLLSAPIWAAKSANPGYRDPILPSLSNLQASASDYIYNGPTYNGYSCIPTGDASIIYSVTGSGCVFTGQFSWG